MQGIITTYCLACKYLIIHVPGLRFCPVEDWKQTSYHVSRIYLLGEALMQTSDESNYESDITWLYLPNNIAKIVIITRANCDWNRLIINEYLLLSTKKRNSVWYSLNYNNNNDNNNNNNNNNDTNETTTTTTTNSMYWFSCKQGITVY